MKLNATISITV